MQNPAPIRWVNSNCTGDASVGGWCRWKSSSNPASPCYHGAGSEIALGTVHCRAAKTGEGEGRQKSLTGTNHSGTRLQIRPMDAGTAGAAQKGSDRCWETDTCQKEIAIFPCRIMGGLGLLHPPSKEQAHVLTRKEYIFPTEGSSVLSTAGHPWADTSPPVSQMAGHHVHMAGQQQTYYLTSNLEVFLLPREAPLHRALLPALSGAYFLLGFWARADKTPLPLRGAF